MRTDTDARQFDSDDGIARCGAPHKDGTACWAHLEHDGACPNTDQHAPTGTDVTRSRAALVAEATAILNKVERVRGPSDWLSSLREVFVALAEPPGGDTESAAGTGAGTGTQDRILADAMRYYAQRRPMNNPKGWAHVLRVVDSAISRGLYDEVPETEQAAARAVLTALVNAEETADA